MAFIAKQRYRLDITPRGGWVIVYASQHDDEAREIEFEIINQGRHFPIPESLNISVQGTKSNGGYFSHSCTYSGNIVTMPLADDMTDVIGKAVCVLKFTNTSNQKLATAKFILNVDIDSSSSGVIIDTEAEEIFNQMLNEIRAQASAISVDIAELQSMVGSPLVASLVSEMTEHDKIYVYVGSESGYINGNWYYWDGSAWVSGGVYNAVAFETDTTLTQSGQPADAKATGDRLHNVEDELGVNPPDVYSGTLTQANTDTTIVDNLSFERATQYKYKFEIGAALNTNCDFTLKSGGESDSTLFSKTIVPGETSAERVYTTSASYDITEGYIVCRANATGVNIKITIEPVVGVPTRLDIIETQIIANATKVDEALNDIAQLSSGVFSDLTELSKEIDGNIPLRYSATTGEANVTIPLIEHFALEKSTQYVFTFKISEAINTVCYFYIYKDQETQLIIKQIAIGDTEVTYTLNTSASVPFTDGKINVQVNKANVYCEVEIKPTSAIQSRVDKLETQLNTDITRVEGKSDSALEDIDSLSDTVGVNKSLINTLANEIGVFIPVRYTGESGEANVETVVVPHLALDRGTQYKFTFSIKEAINTAVYFKVYKDQSTQLITKTVAIGDTSVTYNFTTSTSTPFTDGKISVTVNKANVNCEILLEKTGDPPSRIDDLLEAPLTTLPAYVRGCLAYRPLGALSKPYLHLASDDGNITLNTYTIPMLLEKEVPCTFALFRESAVLQDETNIAIVKNALENGGCSVAQHGGHYWTQFTERQLNEFFAAEAAFFEELEIDVEGAVFPGGYTNDMITSLVGGLYGVMRTTRVGHGSPRMVNYETGAAGGTSDIYANGPRSNIYSLTSVNVADYSEATLKAAIDAAIANNWLISIYWHDDSLSAADKTRLENVIDYAKTTGITFTTLGDIMGIT